MNKLIIESIKAHKILSNYGRYELIINLSNGDIKDIKIKLLEERKWKH